MLNRAWIWLALATMVLSGCRAEPRGGDAPGTVRGITFLPEIAAEPARRAHVLYQDGALVTPVPGGTLWTFGDTFLGTMEGGKPKYAGALSNTMAHMPEGAREWPPSLTYLTVGDGVAAAPLSLIAEEDVKTRRLWPLAGVWVGETQQSGTAAKQQAGNGGRAYMFYGLIEVTGPGPWGFKAVGTGLARAEHAFGPYTRLRDGAGTYGRWPMDPSAIVKRDGYLYLYAPRRFKGDRDPSSGLLVGRVREGDIEDPHRYQFFAGLDGRGGARWVANIEEAGAAADGVWGQASVAWNSYLRAYVLATSSNFFHNDQVQLRQGATPWGPWRAIGPGDGFIKIPEREEEKTQLIYCTMLHPELDEDGGRVMTLTYCRMLTREWAFTNPEGVRVELGRSSN